MREWLDELDPLWSVKGFYACVGALTGLIVGGLVASC
jgi:hypothetical protein